MWRETQKLHINHATPPTTMPSTAIPTRPHLPFNSNRLDQACFTHWLELNLTKSSPCVLTPQGSTPQPLLRSICHLRMPHPEGPKVACPTSSTSSVLEISGPSGKKVRWGETNEATKQQAGPEGMLRVGGLRASGLFRSLALGSFGWFNYLLMMLVSTRLSS